MLSHGALLSTPVRGLRDHRLRSGRRGSGVFDPTVFRQTVERPGELAPGHHVVLDSEEMVAVRWDQVI